MIELEAPPLDDPDQARHVRRGIIRTAIIWTPLFAICLGAWVYFLADQVFGLDRGGTWFLVVVLSIFAFLTGTQSIQALRDLREGPQELEGEVRRRWSHRESFVWPTTYIRIGKKVLRGDGWLLQKVSAGDRVRLRYYPHSAVLIGVQRVQTEPPSLPPSKQLRL